MRKLLGIALVLITTLVACTSQPVATVAPSSAVTGASSATAMPTSAPPATKTPTPSQCILEPVVAPTPSAENMAYLQLDPDKGFMGVAGRTPYALKLTRGKLQRIAYLAALEAEGGGVAGTVEPAPKAPFELPLAVGGVNRNWEAGVWREGGALVPFGVFEGKGYARLDVTQGGRFFAGNLVAATDPRLRLSIVRWDAQGILIEANNPTPTDLESE